MKRYLMIGAPISTVRTPPLLEAGMKARGMAVSVEVRHLEPSDLVSFVFQVRRDAIFAGLLVTMPHKRTIVPCLDRLTAQAIASGSVNTVRRLHDGSLEGAQFDGLALVAALETAGVDFPGSRFVLRGLGGAGLAIAVAIAERGTSGLWIADTDPRRVAKAQDALAASGTGTTVHAGPPPSGCEVLVNATPLGMRGHSDASPFSKADVQSATYVADIVADPPHTRLASQARECSCHLISGRDMVHAQIDVIADWLCDSR